MDRLKSEIVEHLSTETETVKAESQVEILYGPHIKKADQLPARELFQDCDIFVPEHPDWNEEIKSIYNKVSHGETTPEDALKELRKFTNFPSFEKAQLEMIFGSNKPIAFADISSVEPEIQIMFESLDRLQEAYMHLLLGGKDFDQGVEGVKLAIKNFIDIQKTREGKIAENLGHELESAVGNLPEIKGKKDLKVLMTLGAAHTGLFHLLRSKGVSVKARFIETPFIYGYDAEMARRAMFDKEISEGLVSKAVLSGAIESLFKSNLPNTTKLNSAIINKFTRRVLDAFSESEAVILLKGFRDIESGEEKMEYLNSQIGAKNITIPKSSKQLLEFVK